MSTGPFNQRSTYQSFSDRCETLVCCSHKDIIWKYCLKVSPIRTQILTNSPCYRISTKTIANYKLFQAIYKRGFSHCRFLPSCPPSCSWSVETAQQRDVVQRCDSCVSVCVSDPPLKCIVNQRRDRRMYGAQ